MARARRFSRSLKVASRAKSKQWSCRHPGENSWACREPVCFPFDSGTVAASPTVDEAAIRSRDARVNGPAATDLGRVGARSAKPSAIELLVRQPRPDCVLSATLDQARLRLHIVDLAT